MLHRTNMPLQLSAQENGFFCPVHSLVAAEKWAAWLKTEVQKQLHPRIRMFPASLTTSTWSRAQQPSSVRCTFDVIREQKGNSIRPSVCVWLRPQFDAAQRSFFMTSASAICSDLCLPQHLAAEQPLGEIRRPKCPKKATGSAAFDIRHWEAERQVLCALRRESEAIRSKFTATHPKSPKPQGK